tara:strand:- start:203 stop:475 length:273 start_codon:yes stop_codon:yes gene_type:complete
MQSTSGKKESEEGESTGTRNLRQKPFQSLFGLHVEYLRPAYRLFREWIFGLVALNLLPPLTPIKNFALDRSYPRKKLIETLELTIQRRER